ncbi:MAG: hypothetical protein KKA73_25100 [Chloroflexi bacterium]|nr:hypothetical protein [Chloroflexota bacterium]MBU1750975.1 hypothetical protein [Chloroflexota bacterium]MBU1877396.1 hypothetical protein [Chloroflexota bacterium]
MSTSIKFDMERIDDSTVAWKVKAETDQYFLQVSVSVEDSMVFNSPEKTINSVGSGGTVRVSIHHWGGARYNATAIGRPKQGNPERASVSGTMASNQSFSSASDTTP